VRSRGARIGTRGRTVCVAAARCGRRGSSARCLPLELAATRRRLISRAGEQPRSVAAMRAGGAHRSRSRHVAVLSPWWGTHLSLPPLRWEPVLSQLALCSASLDGAALVAAAARHSVVAARSQHPQPSQLDPLAARTDPVTRCPHAPPAAALHCSAAALGGRLFDRKQHLALASASSPDAAHRCTDTGSRHSRGRRTGSRAIVAAGVRYAIASRLAAAAAR
jgi:hypothetical protein